MTQPAETPLYITSILGLNPCAGTTDWMTGYSTPTAAWAACVNGEWMMWFLFAQATTLAQRQQLATALVQLLTPVVNSTNILTPATLTQAQAAVTALQGFGAGTVTAKALVQVANPLEYLRQPDNTPAGLLEFETMYAVLQLARSCTTAVPSEAAKGGISFATTFRHVMIRLNQAADMPTASAALAVSIRGLVNLQFNLPQ